VELFPGVVAAPLLLGSIAGTGGRFCIDPILAAIGELPGTPRRQPCSFGPRTVGLHNNPLQNDMSSDQSGLYGVLGASRCAETWCCTPCRRSRVQRGCRSKRVRPAHAGRASRMRK